MVQKIAIGLVSQMVTEKMIDVRQKENYIYTLVSLLERCITVGTILLFSALIGKLAQAVLFLVFFLSLRKRTGGYHLNTFFQCYVATLSTFILVIGVCDILVAYPRLVLGMLFVAMCIVESIGTVNHPNLHMDNTELEKSKKAARILVLLECSLIYCFALIGMNMVYVCYMSIAIILCATLLGIAKILKQEVIGSEEN